MEIAQFLETLDREGQLLAAAAGRAGSKAKVPTCPDWQVRDLLRHTGMVHRWATAFVAERHTSYQPDAGLPDLDGDELLTWFREGHRRLVDTLAAAPPDTECWSFMPAPSPLAFWARRQAHETTVHRVDAESALGTGSSAVGTNPGAIGTNSSPVATDFALDGIDELLGGFHNRGKSKVRSEEPRTLRVRATDAEDAAWTVRLSPEPPVIERGADGHVDCELVGPADQLYLSLWNRRPFPEVTGDAEVAALWRETSAVTWN
ncbi:maleylpyruvate isomerase family mycothiol-dependent enzyme [Streptomyces sp. NPDC005496]|uniref:maleylpyruvate isomerase family mycothiol-dependent enzyme n=1 Tax=unclassified Streptomyces TaxID=2593676 RepID=UPI0033B13A43